MLAYYLHDLSPHLIKFGRFQLHWYGLSYVLGFWCGYLVMKRLAKQGLGSLKPEHVADFITFAALFGVVLGGRLGYMLFYNFGEFIRAPWIFVRLWDGGMSSHGGIIGLALFYWARRHKISWTGIGDNLVTAAPIGLFFGRIANFINGELYGRITSSSWAMKFPTEVHDRKTGFFPSEIGIMAEPNKFPMHSNEIIEFVKQQPNGLARLEASINLRHPSQLYEAACEGLLLFVVLYLVRTRWKNLSDGITTGLFFLLYAIARISIENLRQPDSEEIMGLTRGQFYSMFMIAAGVAFIVYGGKHKRRSVPGG